MLIFLIKSTNETKWKIYKKRFKWIHRIGFGDNWIPIQREKKKIKLDPFLKPYTRISSKFTRDLNIKNIKGHGTDDNNLGVGETLKI